MSEFYGRVHGSRGPATRQGSKGSGITSSANTWNSHVRVEMYTNPHAVSGHMTDVSITGYKTGARVFSVGVDTDALAEAVSDGNAGVKQELLRAETALQRAHDKATKHVERKQS